MKSEKAGYLYASLAAISWASAPAVSKLLLRDLDVFQVLFFSNLVAAAALLIISAALGKLPLIKAYTSKNYLIFAFMGLLGIFLYRLFLQEALVLMPAQEAFIINYTWPIMVVFFAWVLLKEKITRLEISGLVLSFIGVVTVTTKGNFSSLDFSVSGVAFALSAAVFYGLYSVLGKGQKYEKYTAMACFYMFSLVYATAALILFSKIPSISLGQGLGLLWLGLFPNAFAYIFWLLALKQGSAAKVSNLIFITPFLSLIYIYFLLGETILLSSIIGLVVIIAGIFLPLIKKKALKNKLINP